MPLSLILTIIQLLPELFSAVNKLTSLTGNTQAKIDAAVALLINAIPDSLAPAFIPEAKQLIMDAVSIYDKIAPMFEGPAAPAPVAAVAAAPLKVTGTLMGSVLGSAMPE